jgi:hypothetical protein
LRSRRFGFKDGKAIYYRIAMAYVGQVNVDQLDREGALALESKLNKVMDDFNARAPKGVNKGFMCSY